MPVQGSQSEKVAQDDTKRLKTELVESGLKFHQFQGPTNRINFLGAIIDTLEMTVAIPEERIRFMLEYIGEWRGETTYTLKNLSSLIGLLLYLSQIVEGIKSTTAFLIKKRTEMTRSGASHAQVSQRIDHSLARIAYILSNWKQ